MDHRDNFDGYVEALPAMLTLLTDAVDDRGPLAPFILELRTALGAAFAAAERLRIEHRRVSRRAQLKSGRARAHLHLVPTDPVMRAHSPSSKADPRDHDASSATAGRPTANRR